MALLSRWFQRRAPSEQEHSVPSADAIAQALNRDISVVAAQDPETTTQWNLLRVRIASAAHPVQSARRPKPVRRVNPATVFGLAGAATVVAVSILLFRPTAPVKYHTGDREQNVILLSDGSEVMLNHNSDLSVNLKDAGNGRRTDLKGEAYFKVQKTGSPFIVKTELGSVQVLGTEFNVRMRRGLMEVAVVSGRVRVTASRDGKDSTVILQGGEITAIVRGAYPESPRRLPFVNDYPGWIHGKFIFQRATLESACLDIAEQFGTSIIVRNPDISQRTITGVVDGRNLETAMKTLCLLSGTSYRHEDSGYTLY